MWRAWAGCGRPEANECVRVSRPARHAALRHAAPDSRYAGPGPMRAPPSPDARTRAACPAPARWEAGRGAGGALGDCEGEHVGEVVDVEAQTVRRRLRPQPSIHLRLLSSSPLRLFSPTPLCSPPPRLLSSAPARACRRCYNAVPLRWPTLCRSVDATQSAVQRGAAAAAPDATQSAADPTAVIPRRPVLTWPGAA